jgi:Flp pilus assembly protein TadD
MHGMARSLLARNQLDEAMNQAQAALKLSPRDLEIHHTVGAIYERMHKFEEAAAYGNASTAPEQGHERKGRVEG